MKKFTLIASFLLCYWQLQAQSIIRCGNDVLQQKLIASHPELKQTIENIKLGQIQRASAYKASKALNAAERTTGISAVPIVFHIVLDSTQLAAIGGTSGVIKRADSQIAVINRDYNRGNSDSILIPGAFKPLYSNVGIHFALASVDPNGNSTPGYEIVTTTASGFDLYDDSVGSKEGFSDAKYASSGGANIWDPTKYLNVWIINPTYGGSTLLGLTIPPSFIDSMGFNNKELGIVLNYGAFGVQTSSGDYFVTNITEGRTLTHELGHYFEIWHVFGDGNGYCPWNGGGDDGIADTPPQAYATFGCPSFPQYDACDTAKKDSGHMFMNYLDYSDDDCMHMFTIDQATRMQSSIFPGTSESYSLTQHPELTTAVAEIQPTYDFSISPNPTKGQINIYFNQVDQSLQAINIVNMLGQNVANISVNNQINGLYTVDLSNMSKGIYFVQCRFKEGITTRKIVLQ